jgi:hypothetical protein
MFFNNEKDEASGIDTISAYETEEDQYKDIVLDSQSFALAVGIVIVLFLLVYVNVK